MRIGVAVLGFLVATLVPQSVLPNPGYIEEGITSAKQPIQPTLRVRGIALIPGRTSLGPGKVLADRCALDRNCVHVFRGAWREVKPECLVRDGSALRATLSPSGLVAIETSTGTTVIDTHGRWVADWEGARAPRWDPQNDRLAMLTGGYKDGPEGGLLVWNPRRGISDTYEIEAEEFGWGTRDSVFVRSGGEVVSIDLRNDSRSSVLHRGVEVSNDGLLSLERSTSKERSGNNWRNFIRAGFRLWHDQGPSDLTSRALDLLGAGGLTQVGPVFWIRSPGDHHLLCISGCGHQSQPDGKHAWSCRTAIVDVLAEEVVASVPGYSLGPSADSRGAWVYDGYDVFPFGFVWTEIAGQTASRCGCNSPPANGKLDKKL